MLDLCTLLARTLTAVRRARDLSRRRRCAGADQHLDLSESTTETPHGEHHMRRQPC